MGCVNQLYFASYQNLNLAISRGSVTVVNDPVTAVREIQGSSRPSVHSSMFPCLALHCKAGIVFLQPIARRGTIVHSSRGGNNDYIWESQAPATLP